MNTEQAIEYWSKFHSEIEELEHTPLTDIAEWDRQEEATVIAIEALKKQIKVTPEPGGYCPRCGHKILLQRQEYCGNCGQAIRRAK